MNQLVEKDIQLLNETLSLSSQITEIGIEEMKELQEQNKQLNSIHSDLIDIDIQQQLSKETLKKIHHPFGGFHSLKSLFSKRKEEKTGKIVDKMDKQVKKEMKHELKYYQLKDENEIISDNNHNKNHHNNHNHKNGKKRNNHSNRKKKERKNQQKEYYQLPDHIQSSGMNQEYQNKLDILEQTVNEMNFLSHEINKELILTKYQIEMNKQMMNYQEKQLEKNISSMKKVKK